MRCESLDEAVTVRADFKGGVATPAGAVEEEDLDDLLHSVVRIKQMKQLLL